MALSDLQVFNEYAYTTMSEMLAQQVDKFNAATQGGLILRTASHQGDYSDEALYAKIAGLVRRRDSYGSGAVAAKVLSHLLNTSVKVAAGTPPVNIDPGMFKWIQRSPEEAGVVIGKQLAGDTMADMLNTAIMVYVAGLGQVAGNIHDGTAGTATLAGLNTAAGKFGDRSQDITTWLMHSKVAHDIYAEALTNTNRLFVFGSVAVIEDGFGRPIVVTDSANLITAGAPDTYHSLGLAAGAVLVDQNNDYTDNIQTANGDENILRTFQAEWSYNLGLKGFAWDKTNGGASPTDAALGTATNWDQFSTSDKDLCGVMLNSQ